jgi:2-polyprenyl-3-methyl-5-hydroxy-6-metoxy-1,4-benzoquinol methylase
MDSVLGFATRRAIPPGEVTCCMTESVSNAANSTRGAASLGRCEIRGIVGPFGDAELYRASGNSNLQSIIDLCGLKPHAQVLEVGCGCGRIATSLASYLADSGGYVGFDVAEPLINWCREEMQPRLPASASISLTR